MPKCLFFTMAFVATAAICVLARTAVSLFSGDMEADRSPPVTAPDYLVKPAAQSPEPDRQTSVKLICDLKAQLASLQADQEKAKQMAAEIAAAKQELIDELDRQSPQFRSRARELKWLATKEAEKKGKIERLESKIRIVASQLHVLQRQAKWGLATDDWIMETPGDDAEAERIAIQEIDNRKAEKEAAEWEQRQIEARAEKDRIERERLAQEQARVQAKVQRELQLIAQERERSEQERRLQEQTKEAERKRLADAAEAAEAAKAEQIRAQEYCRRLAEEAQAREAAEVLSSEPAAACLLRNAISFQNLGNTDACQVWLHKTVQRFPKTAAAAECRRLLEESGESEQEARRRDDENLRQDQYWAAVQQEASRYASTEKEDTAPTETPEQRGQDWSYYYRIQADNSLSHYRLGR